MPAPVLSSFAQELYDHLVTFAYDDANRQYALANFCAAYGEMYQVVEDLSRDQVVDGKTLPGWSQAFDVDRCPVYALPWLGQFVGAVVNTSLSEANQRQQLRDVNNWQRGSLSAIAAAPLPWLTGTQTVIIRERFNSVLAQPDPYWFEVITLTSETTDSVAALAALTAQKPAGLIMTYNVLAGQDWLDLRTNYANFQLVKNAYVTLAGVRANLPGT